MSCDHCYVGWPGLTSHWQDVGNGSQIRLTDPPHGSRLTLFSQTPAHWLVPLLLLCKGSHRFHLGRRSGGSSWYGFDEELVA